MTTVSIYLQRLKSFIPALNVFFGSKAGIEPLDHSMSPKGELETLNHKLFNGKSANFFDACHLFQSLNFKAVTYGDLAAELPEFYYVLVTGTAMAGWLESVAGSNGIRNTCGSHRFSLIENSAQTALVYHDRKSQRNILDQIQDEQYAQPGLWDFADQVSVSSPYPEQQLYYQFSGKSAQAWVVGINDKDRAEFGTLYARAVNEILACF